MSDGRTVITQKRTLRLKMTKAAPASDGGASTVAPETAAATPVAAAAPVSDGGMKGTLIMAVLAAVFFLALLLVQWVEWSHYAAPPSVWPVRQSAAP